MPWRRICARVLRSQERRCSRLLRSKAPCLILDPRYHIWSGVPTLGSHTIPSLGGGSDSTAAKPCRAAWIPYPSKPLLFPAHTLLGLPILGPRLTSKSTKNSIRSSHRQGQNGMAFQYILSFVRAHTSRGCGKSLPSTREKLTLRPRLLDTDDTLHCGQVHGTARPWNGNKEFQHLGGEKCLLYRKHTNR